ncbi:hypothetical protein E2C01_017157 [Portunus trituberculatus]|uniref:Uncharacterized protein n=1 Tax=Portunus trituberculatus TaxID=210409 RepID=A0A5B7DS58_PORTR|nr:hypothetical protein [Portunus trituberculatus]
MVIPATRSICALFRARCLTVIGAIRTITLRLGEDVPPSLLEAPRSRDHAAPPCAASPMQENLVPINIMIIGNSSTADMLGLQD